MLTKKKSRIKDIAQLAKVSIGTIDRVLHKRGRVSKQTEQKVNEIIMKLNYKPNILARALVINKKYTIGLFIPNQNDDEYWEQAFEGVHNLIQKFEQQGLYVELYVYSSENKKSFEATGRKIIQSRPDGVIMTPIFLHEGLSFYKQCCDLSIPVIMFNTTIPNMEPLSFIGIDSYQSGRVAAELLTMTAHKKGKFAIFHFDEELVNAPHMLERERGLISYLKERCPDREYMIKTLNNKQHYYNGQLKEILKKDEINGIFVSTSKTHRVGSYLQKENIRGIILIGYDLTNKNIKLLKSEYISFLINQNPRQQVEQSIMTFFNYLIYGESVISKKLFPVEIITPTNIHTYLNKSLEIFQPVEIV
jgi:LacI family transcriptional regulator